MRFSCAKCGQRYSSVDEPRAGNEYRVPCVACGATVLLKGADFPALPTALPGAGALAAPGALDASGESPLSLALDPMVVAALARGGPTRAASPAREPGPRHWIPIAVGAGVALATLAALLLLVLGGQPSDSGSPAPSAASPGTAVPARAAPSPRPSPARPVALAPEPRAPGRPTTAAVRDHRAQLPPTAPAAKGSGVAGAPSQKDSPPVAPSASATAKGVAPPAARRVADPSRPGPTAAAAAGAPSPARTPAEQVVADALAARRPAFESCVRERLRANPGSDLSGRRVTISLMVNPNGTVGSSTIDDWSIEATPLGTCLLDVASRPFPTFEGEPFQVVVPLKLGD